MITVNDTPVKIESYPNCESKIVVPLSARNLSSFDLLQDVFIDGKLVREQTFAEIRETLGNIK